MTSAPYHRRTALAIALLATISWPPSAFGETLDTCLAEAWPQRQITCLTDFAIELEDPALCLRSGEPAVRWRCVAGYAESAGDASPCGILPVEDLDAPRAAEELCRAHLAITWREPTQCMDLTTPNLADSCLLQLVQLGEDTALCARIENVSIADACRDL